MIDLTIHKRFRYVLFTGLYLAEGIYQTMLLFVTPLYLIEKNVPIPIITLVMGIGEAPWALKFVWGGVIDFYHKYGRKKFTVIGTIVGALGFLILALIDQYFSLIFFTLFLFIGHTGIGFLDAGADAWAIDITTKKDRGKINASMNIGKSASGALGGPALIILGITFGYNIAFIFTGVVILFLAIIPLMVKYEARDFKKIEIWPLVKQEFSNKSTRLVTLYFFIVVLNPGIIATLFVIIGKTVLLFEDTTQALIGVIVFFIGTIPGSIIGGIMADRLGRKKTLYIFLTLIIITSLLPLFIFYYDFYFVILYVGLLSFFWSGETAATWAMVMDIINPKIGAAQHEIMCSIANAGDMVISAAAGTFFILLGFPNIYLIPAIIMIPAFITLIPIKSDKIK
ncbi:MFS transporter [Thermoplasmatota archaeon]